MSALLAPGIRVTDYNSYTTIYRSVNYKLLQSLERLESNWVKNSHYLMSSRNLLKGLCLFCSLEVFEFPVMLKLMKSTILQ